MASEGDTELVSTYEPPEFFHNLFVREGRDSGILQKSKVHPIPQLVFFIGGGGFLDSPEIKSPSKFHNYLLQEVFWDSPEIKSPSNSITFHLGRGFLPNPKPEVLTSQTIFISGDGEGGGGILYQLLAEYGIL